MVGARITWNLHHATPGILTAWCAKNRSHASGKGTEKHEGTSASCTHRYYQALTSKSSTPSLSHMQPHQFGALLVNSSRRKPEQQLLVGRRRHGLGRDEGKGRLTE